MNRREAIKFLGLSTFPLVLPNSINPFGNLLQKIPIHSSDFGNFTWGVATAAAQIEGAWDTNGKGVSIWDTYAHKKGNIKDGSNADVSCNFYNNYKNDLQLVSHIGFNAFRFSVSWPRIFPNGKGQINTKGIDFYNKLIDSCLELGLSPWLTLYHWDLPQTLEDKGGWTNREIVGWFSDYSENCAKHFGDRVNRWLILNEPLSFTLFGYGIGIHAPGNFGLNKFFSAVHHAALCQAEGGRIVKNTAPNALVGTAFSCSPIDPHKQNSKRDIRAAKRLDAIINRMFVEPALGMGYPVKDAPILQRLEKYMQQDDEKKLAFNFDFFGLQNYFRIVIDDNPFVPILKTTRIAPDKLGNPITEMNWEVYPEGIYRSLMQFSKYPVKELVVTENGAAFKDKLEDKHIHDDLRIKYFNDYLEYLLKAKKEIPKLTGYFAWTLLDNFEWAEGYRPKFGIIYVDRNTQERIIKDSGMWFKNFLK